MTKEQKDKIHKMLAEERNDYAKDCRERISKEYGKIIGADYMLQRLLDVIRTDVDEDEEHDIVDLGNGVFEKRYKSESEEIEE